MSNEQIEARNKLLRDMKRTKGVRFNASRRLEAYERSVSRNNAYASAAVIVITLLPSFFSLSGFWIAVIALMTVGLSIFILAFTLLHSANNSALKADQFHRCALEVNALRRELLADLEADVARFAKLYDDILGRYNINHEDVDYDKYRLEHPEEFPEVATEEVASARANVSASEGWIEKFAFRLSVITAVVAISSILPTLIPSVQELLDSIEEVVRDLGTKSE